jgi:hypothetical protein
MSEDHIGREDFLEFLEAFFDRRTEVGKESISKGFHHDSLLARPPEERAGAASGFLAAFRVGTENEPIELDSIRLLDKVKDRSPASDFNVVAVSSKAQNPFYATQAAGDHVRLT